MITSLGKPLSTLSATDNGYDNNKTAAFMVAVFIIQTYSPSSYLDILLYIRLCIVTSPALRLHRLHHRITLGTYLELSCPLHRALRGCWHIPPPQGVGVLMCLFGGSLE